jgi:hypothetical protein
LSYDSPSKRLYYRGRQRDQMPTRTTRRSVTTTAVLLLLAVTGASLRSEFSPAEIAKRALPAVVAIRVKTSGGELSGSGFIVDPSGTIVTNLHVIRGAISVAVKLANGDTYDQVQVKAFDERKDLAVIQIPAFRLPTLALGDSDAVQPGQPVVIVGNPLGILEGSVSTGVVSGVRSIDGYHVIQTDATANHGNSGGPMLDEHANVIGVVTFKVAHGEADNLNFALPVNYARGLLTSTDSIALSDLEARIGTSTDLFAPNRPAFPQRWKSLESGTTKIIRMDGDYLYVETVIPDNQRQAGGFNITQLKKTGDKYIGTGKSSLLCSYVSGLGAYARQNSNRCSQEYPIEIDILTPTRIEGRTPSPKPGVNVKFDCRKCSYDPAFVMGTFTWIPE